MIRKREGKAGIEMSGDDARVKLRKQLTGWRFWLGWLRRRIPHAVNRVRRKANWSWAQQDYEDQVEALEGQEIEVWRALHNAIDSVWDEFWPDLSWECQVEILRLVVKVYG